MLFALGSARLDGAALEVLECSARGIERLREQAEALGYETVLRLVGRTDGSGTEQTNQALSEARARTVEEALLERGLRVDEVEIEAVGLTEPLTAADLRAGARGLAWRRRGSTVIQKKICRVGLFATGKTSLR